MMSYAKHVQALHGAMVRRAFKTMVPLIKQTRAPFISPEERLAIYTNGYEERLVDATKADYPALCYYIGEQNYTTAVKAFVRETPSMSWDLNLYSIRFADFIRDHAPDKATQDLARLESAIIEVFWAPESDPLNPHVLAELTEEEFGQKFFQLRKASCLLKLECAAHDYLILFRQDAAPETIEDKPQHLLIIRHDHEVKRLLLDEAEYELLLALKNGQNFGEALGAVKTPQALAGNLPGYLARWLDIGAFEVISDSGHESGPESA